MSGASRAALSLAGRRAGAVAIAVLGVAVLAGPAAAAERETAEVPRGEASEGAAPSSGLRVALRWGAGIPIGPAFESSGAMNDSITAYIPLRADVGYRFARHFYVGLDAQLALIVPAGCPNDATCTGSNIRAGAMLAYHLRPESFVDPWLGIGAGFERLTLSRSIDGSSVDMTARGFELVDVDLGADCRLTRGLRVGPVLSSSLARYTSIDINGASTRDFDASLHAWVMLGIRGAYDL